ncbi:hypothetical protein CPB85DRAFT_556160 [Mucidula mucida]|nr:hypothetical protein CPB85DRAFT_556160 [Mucidula mucida]
MSSAKSRMTTHDLIDALGAKLSKKKLRSTRELDVLDSRLQKLVAIVRGQRNALQVVHRLPDEVLASIFWRTQQHLPSFLPTPLHGQTFDSGHRNWLSLLHVCRQWRGVIASSRLLWSTVDNSLMPGKPLFTEHELGLLKPHIHRMRELHLGLSKWTESVETVFEALSSPALALESLTIDTHGAVNAGYHLMPLFAGDMPHLRKLCLEFFTAWPTHYFSGLTSLCLHHQQTPHSLRPSTNEFLNFLEASPHLQELILVYAGPTRDREEDVPSPSPWRKVVLPRLRQFSWGKIEDMLHVQRLLAYLSLPETANLYFWGSSNADGGDLGNLIPIDLTRLPCMLGLREWRLRCSYQPVSSLDPGNYLVAFVDKVLYMLNIAWESYIARVPVVYAPMLSGVQKLYVVDSLNVSTDLWKDLFRSLPRLSHLMLQPPQQWASSRGILGALYPDDTKSTIRTGFKAMLGISDALCPHLRSLSIEADPGFQGFYISAFAKARMKRGSPLHRLEVKHLHNPPNPTYEGGRAAGNGPVSPPDTLGPSALTPVEQMRLDMEDRYALEKTVKEVTYLYDQAPTVFEPSTWPTRGYTWTMMPLPSGQ